MSAYARYSNSGDMLTATSYDCSAPCWRGQPFQERPRMCLAGSAEKLHATAVTVHPAFNTLRYPSAHQTQPVSNWFVSSTAKGRSGSLESKAGDRATLASAPLASDASEMISLCDCSCACRRSVRRTLLLILRSSEGAEEVPCSFFARKHP